MVTSDSQVKRRNLCVYLGRMTVKVSGGFEWSFLMHKYDSLVIMECEKFIEM